MKDVIYYGSYFFILAILLRFYLKRNYSLSEMFFVVGVALVPLGKLFYTPSGGFASITASLVYAAGIGGTGLLLNLIRGVDRFVFLPLIIAIPALFSEFFLTGTGQAAFTSTSAGGSTLLRIVSVFVITVYCCYVVSYVSERPGAEQQLARYYVAATMFATFIGFIIFYGVFSGRLIDDDILPVSIQEVHINGRFYRFNPGANVDEFGQVAGYALLLLRWTGWRALLKFVAVAMFLAAELLSLTRGAWVGLIVAYVVYMMLSDIRYKFYILVGSFLALFLAVTIILSSSDLGQILASRVDFSAGPGGEDRLNTLDLLLRAIFVSPFRLLFGYGWATNGANTAISDTATNDPHDVPLMVFYYTGLVGVLAYATFFMLVGRYLYASVRQNLNAVMAILAFMFTVSLFEHNFYHVQTWLMMGLVLGLALRSARQSAGPPLAQLREA